MSKVTMLKKLIGDELLKMAPNGGSLTASQQRSAREKAIDKWLEFDFSETPDLKVCDDCTKVYEEPHESCPFCAHLPSVLH